MEAPEPYSNEWYRRRLGRIDTNLDRQDNELKDQYTASKDLQKLVDELKSARKTDAATIGELKGRIEVLETWMHEMERIRQERAKANGKGA